MDLRDRDLRDIEIFLVSQVIGKLERRIGGNSSNDPVAQ